MGRELRDIPCSMRDVLPINAQESLIKIQRTQEHITQLQQGAAVLAIAGYAERIHKPLMQAEKGVAKLRDNLQPLGKGMADRKILTHLDALDRAVADEGADVRDAIIQDAICGDIEGGMRGLPLVQLQDVPADYWRQQEQIFREQGRVIHITLVRGSQRLSRRFVWTLLRFDGVFGALYDVCIDNTTLHGNASCKRPGGRSRA